MIRHIRQSKYNAAGGAPPTFHEDLRFKVAISPSIRMEPYAHARLDDPAIQMV